MVKSRSQTLSETTEDLAKAKATRMPYWSSRVIVFMPTRPWRPEQASRRVGSGPKRKFAVGGARH